MEERSGSGERIVFSFDDLGRQTLAAGRRRSPSAAILVLVRWQNAAIAATGVLVGAWWCGGRLTARRTIAAALTAVALTALANAYNDYCDWRLDAVAHPERPLPRGELTEKSALRVAIASGAFAMIGGLAAGAIVGALTPLVVATMILYSIRLKYWGAIGNAIVAVLASMPFAYGGASAGQALLAVPLVIVAVPLHLAREIAKDLDDASADAAVRRTVPVVFGTAAARRALAAALLMFIVALAVFARGRPLFAVVAAPALWLTLLAGRRALAGVSGAPRLFKVAMVLALVALMITRG
ncbi:MAG: geranylgeranylglycerol-phosphate geranylgeranyltransferase [Gemmatimonadaceae bacterium]